jgi:hypothetical protein
MTAHSSHAKEAVAQLSKWGFPEAVLVRIGAFGVLWTVLESTLEQLVWILTEENVQGARPTTDKTTVSDWIKILGKGAKWLTPEANQVLSETADAAFNLMEYRHALVHGWIVPFQYAPFFVRNPSWNGERRRRPSNDAHIDENLLEMAISSASTLNAVAATLKAAPKDSARLIALGTSVRNAKSMANELRHLSELVFHEKY